MTDTADLPPDTLPYWRHRAAEEKARADALLNLVIPIGVALSTEKDWNRLLERILVEAQGFCCADSGSLYLRTGDQLDFAMVRNQSLGLAMGGTTSKPITFPGVPLRDPETGQPNHRYMAAYAALTGRSIHVPDAYQAAEAPGDPAVGGQFDFSGARAFDSRTGYRTVSVLTVPLIGAAGDAIGVLQLINSLHPDTQEIVPFSTNMQQVIEVLGRLAAVALESYLREQKLNDELRALRIEIDQTKKQRQVTEITETDYFQDLRTRSRQLRETRQTTEDSSSPSPRVPASGWRGEGAGG